MEYLSQSTNTTEATNWKLARCGAASAAERDLFFSDDVADVALAKIICGECQLREACYRGAIERREPCGVWGGELFQNGAVLAFKRRRGRPRKEQQLPASA